MLLCCSVLSDEEVGQGLASHLLVDEDFPKRSLAVLYAIAHGSFILSFQWLTDFDEDKGWQSPKAGEEAAYQVKCWTGAAARRAERESARQKGALISASVPHTLLRIHLRADS